MPGQSGSWACRSFPSCPKIVAGERASREGGLALDDSPGSARFPPTRLLLLAVDAVPYRVADAAVARGAFADWSAPATVVAPFPSLTHPAFAALFAPFGVQPSWGYEVRYFDATTNAMSGGNPLTYHHQIPPWGGVIDSGHRGVVGKGANYVTSMKSALAELDSILSDALASDLPAYIGYLGSTDALMHLYGDDSAVEFLCRLGERCDRARAAHLAERGVTLQIALFSDHGCGNQTVHYTGDIRPHLRDAGLRVVDRLQGSRDVVAPTFGIVNYLALFLADQDRAEQAVAALHGHPSVELLAFRSAPDQVEVVGSSGRARLHWTMDRGRRLISYQHDGDDVLELDPVVARLQVDGKFDDRDRAGEDDWLQASACSRYPDGPARLIDALAGDRVRSRATVLASLGPGWSWGWRSAYLGTFVRSGRLKGTHGGLDRESSLAFLIISGPELRNGSSSDLIRADQALTGFAPMVRDRDRHR